MATGPLTQITDLVVPEIFTPYVQQLTEEKSRLIQSGATTVNPILSNFLSGGGLTVDVPSFKDLDNEEENIPTDDPADSIIASYQGGTPTDANRKDSVPKKTGTSTEIAVRISRNQSWSAADLAADLAGADPMGSIASRVAKYWALRFQAIFVATTNGIIKANVAANGGDFQNDVSGAAFADGVTNFSAEAFIDAAATMGDSSDDLSLMMTHSVVMARMKKNNLIDYIPDSEGRVMIPTFLGHEVIVDDGMPATGGVFDTWIFGAGAFQIALGLPKVPTETYRYPQAGNGGGQEVLFTRREFCVHPVGHAFVGTTSKGGPSNGTGANQLNNANSWSRVYPERKQIPFARLVTREF
ncbi:MAG: hypothetical protein JKP98_12490 [Rhodobacteraceae bacterium]|jgi:hypothetical protein|nr:hypothetical protein [Alphaproteobacteria bacterium]MBL4557599.1 hypothetical protein [Paracoccaceae bacterium]